MQALFSHKQGLEANFQIALEHLSEVFSPDLNSMELQDHDQLKADKKLAHTLLHDVLVKKNDTRKNYSEHVIKAVDHEISLMEQQNRRDLSNLRKRMMADVEKLHCYYLSFLDLIFQFRKQAENDTKRNHNNFVNNLLIKQLLLNETVESAILDCNSGWGNEPEVKSWFKSLILTDKAYIAYQSLESPSFEDDHKWILHLIKKIIFKNEVIDNFLEDKDIYWSENQPIVNSLVLKTFKQMEEGEEDFEFQQISYNLEDDKTFFVKLFDETIGLDDEPKNLINKKAVNWDIERLAITDRIIIEMALAEFIFFNSIPIKVTINEYIEVSKLYSTPKSKQFINGMLDVIADELTKTGVIKKSGRGLLDNK